MRASQLSRRAVMKASIAVGVVGIALLYVKNALSSSGELNLMGYSGYPDLAAKVFPAFEKATGIKLNFSEQPNQDSMFAQAKLSRQTTAFDVVEPTLDRVASWASNGLVQGWDTSKLAMGNYIPGLADGKYPH
jgi:spermidine/putrescine transport system substrate-binding protein